MAVAYDGFFGGDVVLALPSRVVRTDGLTMVWLVAELEGYEVVKSGKYLAKRLKKFERFPGVGPCLEDGVEVGLDLCGQVPFLEDVATYAVAVIDQYFAYLGLVEQEGFWDVVRVMEERVRRMAVEAMLLSGVANLIENLKVLEDDG